MTFTPASLDDGHFEQERLLQEVTFILPEKILGYPWQAEEIHQLADWALNAGSGSAYDLLRQVALALEAVETS